MNTALRTASAAIALVLGAGTLAACTTESIEPEGHAFVVGVRSNSAPPAVAALLGYVENIPADSTITLTAITGQPNGVSGGKWVLANRGNSVDNEQAGLRLRANLKKAIEATISDSPEADVLGSIAAAARGIADVEGPKFIYVADSMLATAGAVNFQNGLLQVTGEDVASGVSAVDLPDLDGYSVTILGAGSTTPPQEQLPHRDIIAIHDIWRSVLLAAGAEAVTFREVLGAAAPQNTPPVSLIDPSELPSIAAPNNCEVVIPQTLIRFYGDSAEFISPETARQELTKVAELLKGCSGKITISGTTASPRSAEERAALSLSRAKTARTILADIMGIPASEINVEGLGHVGINDRNPDGTFNEALGAQNRTIRIRYDN